MHMNQKGEKRSHHDPDFPVIARNELTWRHEQNQTVPLQQFVVKGMNGYFTQPASPTLLLLLLLVVVVVVVAAAVAAVVVVVVVAVVVVVVIALKGAKIRDLYSSLRRELSPTRALKWPGRNRVQITCNISSA